MAASMASVVRSAAKRASAQQWSRAATPLVANMKKQMNSSRGAVVALRAQQQQTRSFGVFQNLKDTVTNKMEERNQVKQGTHVCAAVYMSLVLVREQTSKAAVGVCMGRLMVVTLCRGGVQTADAGLGVQQEL